MIAGHINYKYKPTQEIIDRANKFSEELDKKGTVYSEKRNQRDSGIRVQQGAIGKIAEVAVEKWAVENKLTVIQGVDWNIYPAHQKNFASDIIVLKNYDKAVTVSVKSSPLRYSGRTEYMDGTPIPYELPYQFTYTVQLKNNDGIGGTDKGNHDVYVFCNWERTCEEMEVYAWLNSDYINKLLIKPFKDSLKAIKGCIMQKTCGANNGSPLKEFPCGLDELIIRVKNAA